MSSIVRKIFGSGSVEPFVVHLAELQMVNGRATNNRVDGEAIDMQRSYRVVVPKTEAHEEYFFFLGKTNEETAYAHMIAERMASPTVILESELLKTSDKKITNLFAKDLTPVFSKFQGPVLVKVIKNRLYDDFTFPLMPSIEETNDEFVKARDQAKQLRLKRAMKDKLSTDRDRLLHRGDVQIVALEAELEVLQRSTPRLKEQKAKTISLERDIANLQSDFREFVAMIQSPSPPTKRSRTEVPQTEVTRLTVDDLDEMM